MTGPGPGAGGGYPRIFFKKNKNPGHLYFHMVYFLDVGVDYNHVINDVVCPPGKQKYRPFGFILIYFGIF